MALSCVGAAERQLRSDGTVVRFMPPEYAVALQCARHGGPAMAGSGGPDVSFSAKLCSSCG